MTISTSASSITIGGNGATTAFNFSFVYDAQTYLQVIYTDVNGNQNVLTPAQYSISLNPPPAGQQWGIGGSVTYPIAGTPIPSGATLTINRVLPLTQLTSIANQGDFYPEASETAVDVQCMGLQQVAGAQTRSLQFPVTDLITNGTLLSSAARANTLYGFDSSGNPQYVPAGSALTISGMDTILADTYLPYQLNGLSLPIPLSGLTYTLNTGSAVVAGQLSNLTVAFVNTMPANYIHDIYLQPGGVVHIEAQPANNYTALPITVKNSVKLYRVISGASGVSGVFLQYINYQSQLNASDNDFSLEDYVSFMYIPAIPLTWMANTGFSAGQVYVTPAGNIYQVYTGGVSGGSYPTATSGSGPNNTITDGNMQVFFFGTDIYEGTLREAKNSGIEWYFAGDGAKELTSYLNNYNYQGTQNNISLQHIKSMCKHVITARQNSFVYAKGQKMHTAGFNWIASIGGTAAGSTPFSSGYTVGSVVVDGGVTWTAFYAYYGTMDLYWFDLNKDFATPIAADSHDAYAGELGWMTGNYVASTLDTAWLSTNSQQPNGSGGTYTYQQLITAIMKTNITNQLRNQLTNTFQNNINPLDGSTFSVQFCEDGAESWAGVNAWGIVLGLMGDSSNQSIMQSAATTISAGIGALFGTAASGASFWVYFLGANWTTIDNLVNPQWYPYIIPTFWPEHVGMPFTSVAFESARNWAVSKLNSWWARADKDTFPDMAIIWLAADKWGDTEKAIAGVKLAKIMTVLQNAPQSGLLLNNELAYYIRTVSKMSGGEQTIVSYTPTTGLVIENRNRQITSFIGTGAPAFKAYMGSGQTITSTPAKLNFNTVEYDTNLAFDPVTNFRFTAPVAGKYNIRASVDYISAGSAFFGYLFIYKNGSAYRSVAQPSPNTSADVTMEVSSQVTMNAGDYVEIWGSTNSSANPNVYFSELYCTFEGFRIPGI